MKKLKFTRSMTLFVMLLLLIFTAQSFAQKTKSNKNNTAAKAEMPEYFMLRPEVEKQYGYTHAVRIGKDLKISGAVS